MKLQHCGILLALGTLAHAWRATFTEATQCGNVTISWAGLGGEKVGPPFVARLAALGLAPLVINIPKSAWSDTAQAGNYSFTVPWPAGTEYVTSMDDGFGSGTGGVTGVQTVQSSSKADCITSDITQPKHVFDLFGTFVQCSVVSMNWTEPATANTLITGLVPNGVAFALDPPVANSKSTTWNLNIPTGTAFVLMYNTYPGPNLTSPLLISGGDGATQDCLSSGSYPSATAPQAGIAEATSTVRPSTSASATSRTKSTPNVGAIVGATLGAVAFLAVVGFAICLCLRRRRFRPVQLASPGTDKDMNLESVDSSYRHPMVHQNNLPEGAVVLPFVLPNASSSTPGYSIRKGQQPPARADSGGEPSRNTYESTESSHLTARTSSSGTHHEYDNEPVFIRHEDAGRVPVPRVREVIELPPGYDQLSRPLPPAQQARNNQTQRQTEDGQVQRKPGPSR